jgi:hypothetical protein
VDPKNNFFLPLLKSLNCISSASVPIVIWHIISTSTLPTF